MSRVVRFEALVVAGMVLWVAGVVTAGETVRLSGTVWTEGDGPVTVRAWAVGEWLVEHPEDRFRPLAGVEAGAGGAYSLEVPAEALPVSVEAAADGHVGKAFLVVLEEQAELPPVWLPRGRSARIRVVSGGRAVSGAVVWGTLWVGPWGRLPGRWRPVVPRLVTGRKGTADVVMPDREGSVDLRVLGPEGRWASREGVLPLAAPVTLTPAGRELAVRVLSRTGEPVPGALVFPHGAPTGTAARAGEDGRAVVRVPSRGPWSVLVAHGDRMVRVTGTEIPEADTPVEIRLEAPPVVRLVLRGAPGPVVAEADWFPEGSSWWLRAVRETEVSLPRLAESGVVWLWGPGLAPRIVEVEPGQEEMVVPLSAAATVEGRVLGPGGAGVAGVWIGARVPRWWEVLRPGRPVTQVGLEDLGEPLAFSGEDGSFRVAELPAVPLELEARAAGYPPARSGTLKLAPGATRTVELRLVPGAAVTLRAVTPEGDPLAGVEVAVHPASEGGSGVLRLGVVEAPPAGEPLASGVTGEDGRAVVEAVPVGTVDLRLAASGYVARTLPEVEVPAEGIDLGDVELRHAVSVEGRVVDPEGRPVPGAEVMATRSAGFLGLSVFRGQLTADEEGRFVLEGLDPTGEIYLLARAEGWIPGPPVKVALPPEGEVEVPVRRGRKLSGLVVDAASGEPVEGMEVDVAVQRTVTVPGMGEAQSWMPAGRTVTAADGSFRVDDLEPGTVEVRISGKGYRPASVQVTVPEEQDPEPVMVKVKAGETVRGRVLGPDGIPAAGAAVTAESGPGVGTSVHTGTDGAFVLEGLEPGEIRVVAVSEEGLRGEAVTRAGSGEELVIRLERPGRIAGRVADSQGAPVAGAQVTCWGPDGRMQDRVSSGPDGSFVLERVSPGTWRLFVRAEGFAPAGERVEVQPGEETPVEITLEVGGVVEGVVRGLGPSELERCQVSGGGSGAVVHPDGTFRMEGVRLGRVRVTAMLMPGSRSRSAVVELSDPDEPGWVELDFGGGVTLSGTVTRAGVGVGGLTVAATALGGGDGGATATAEDGSWEIGGLAPGEYRLEVRSPAGEVLAGEHLVLDGDRQVDLEVPAGGLEGRIFDGETGEPVEGAAVEVRRQGIPGVQRRTGSGAGGRFRLEELPDGEYAVTVKAPEYRPARVQAGVRDGLFTPLDVELERGEGLGLLVRSPSGGTVPSIWVVPLGGGAVGGTLSTPCDGEGRCTLRDLPAGSWVLLVGASSARGLIRAENPGPEVTVSLKPGGTLRVTAPSAGGVLWRVRITEAGTGLPLPVRRWANPAGGEWVPVPETGLTLAVPAGSWTVQAAAPDGTTRARTVEVPAGDTAEVALAGE